MNKNYFVKSQGMGGTSFKTWMAVIMVLLGVAGLFLRGGLGVTLGVGLLLLFTVHWEKNNPIVQLHGDHLEVKAGMIASKRLVLYRDIVGVKRVSSARAFVTTADGKQVNLPLVALEPSAANDLLLALQERVNAGREAPAATLA